MKVANSCLSQRYFWTLTYCMHGFTHPLPLLKLLFIAYTYTDYFPHCVILKLSIYLPSGTEWIYSHRTVNPFTVTTPTSASWSVQYHIWWRRRQCHGAPVAYTMTNVMPLYLPTILVVCQVIEYSVLAAPGEPQILYWVPILLHHTKCLKLILW